MPSDPRTAAVPATPRRVAVFGATGQTGRALVRQAVARGHAVTAVGRDEPRLRRTLDGVAPAPALAVGDLTDPAFVSRAVEGQGAVLVALGPRTGEDPRLLTVALRHVVDAMTRAGVARLLVVSGAGIRVAGDRKLAADRAISALGRVVDGDDVEAKEAQLALLQGTTLDWTVVRPPRLAADDDGAGAAGAPAPRPLVADPHELRGGRRLPHGELAAWMLDELEARRWVRQAVFVGRG